MHDGLNTDELAFQKPGVYFSISAFPFPLIGWQNHRGSVKTYKNRGVGQDSSRDPASYSLFSSHLPDFRT